jgi:hypothetical protein
MRKILEAIIVGILFGLLTRIAEQYLPSKLSFLTETKIIWLLPAFLLAFNMPLRRRQTDSIIVATITLLVTGYTYYFAETIKNGNSITISEEIIQFSIIGFFAGIATGFFAFLGHSATNQFIRYGSMSLLPAIFTGDGIENIINTFNNFEFTPEIGTKVIGGILFYMLIAGKNKFKRQSLIAFLTLAIISALIYLYMV